jgi:hypothetical protein
MTQFIALVARIITSIHRTPFVGSFRTVRHSIYGLVTQNTEREPMQSETSLRHKCLSASFHPKSRLLQSLNRSPKKQSPNPFSGQTTFGLAVPVCQSSRFSHLLVCGKSSIARAPDDVCLPFFLPFVIDSGEASTALFSHKIV